MRKSLFSLLLLALLTLGGLMAFKPAPTVNYTYMHVTSIESIVAGGIGRSRMLYNPEFKGKTEINMENLFSLTGINLGNVNKNEVTILNALNEVSADGWELVQAIPLTQTLQSTGSTQQGIFLTRYLFRKAQ